MTLRLTIGIDPGLTGAIAAVADGEPAGCYDMPTRARRRGTGREIDAHRLQELLREILRNHQGAAVTVVLEVVAGFTGRAASRSFTFGQGDGKVRAVLECMGLDLTMVEVYPQTWKGHYGLLAPRVKNGEPKPPVPGKDASRARVVAMFPNQALPFLRAKDDGRAEALLLALWAIQTEAAA
mgnify:CR=1 FL=1